MKNKILVLFLVSLLVVPLVMTVSESPNKIKIYDEKNKEMIIEEDFTIKLPEVNKQVSKQTAKATISIVSNKNKVEVSSSEFGGNVNLGEEQIIPWGIERANAPSVWEKVKGNKIKIAVLDTGIDYNHPDLNVAGGISFIDEDYIDYVGHGTAVAGVISAIDNDFGIIGVAPKVELYAIKVMNEEGGRLSDILNGIDWAIENDMDIISMSFGTATYSRALEYKLAEAYEAGIIIIAAAGNTNEDVWYPAKYSSVIAVSSTDENNEIYSSNYGNELELVAPGKDIITTSLDKKYSSISGTSMATPHVAGVASLILEDNPSLTPNEIRAKLQRDAIDLGEEGKDNYFGYGLINVNLEEEDLSATIQIVFPEEINKTKKKELEINPIKVEIIKIEDEKENIVHTLFYDGNQGTQNISVKAGQYEINQYFGDEIYTNEYNVSEGDFIVVPLYKTDLKLEFVIDAPYKIKSDQQIPLLIIFHDVDETLDGYTFYDIEIWDDKSGSEELKYTLTPENLGLSTYHCSGVLGDRDYAFLDDTSQYHYWHKLVYLNQSRFDDSDGFIYIKAKVDGNDEFICPNGWDRDQEDSLKIEINDLDLPKFDNWYCGDTHYHSEYTDTDPTEETLGFGTYLGEFGGKLDITFLFSDMLGIDWVTITDHSNSFSLHKNDDLSWSNFKDECGDYNKCLIGTEINCDYYYVDAGNHLLAYDYDNFIDDRFVDGWWSEDNNPSCEEMIAEVKRQGGFVYPAHPETELGIPSGGILDDLVVSKWNDYSLPFNGLEIWNGDIIDPEKGGKRTQALEDGLEQWKELILDERRVFISAGSDAHGDFQELGKEYTCVYAASYSKSNIFDGLKNGNSFISNNGALIMEVGHPSYTPINIMGKLGETIDVCDNIQFRFNIDYNLINPCHFSVYEGDINSKTEKRIEGPNLIAIAGENEYDFLGSGFASDNVYYRIECISEDGKNRIYTNPIWVNVYRENFDGDEICDYYDEDDDGDDVLDANELEGCQFDVDCDDDGYNDGIDAFPKDPTEWSDNDHDGMGDNADLDDDNDAIEDVVDLCSLDYGQDYEQGCPDLVPPEVTLNLSNNLVLVDNEITITCEVNDTDPDPIHKLLVTKPSNETISLNCSSTTFNETSKEGNYTVYFEATDHGNNSANVTEEFSVVEYIPLNVTINNPIKGDIYDNNTLLINLTTNKPAMCSYRFGFPAPDWFFGNESLGEGVEIWFWEENQTLTDVFLTEHMASVNLEGTKGDRHIIFICTDEENNTIDSEIVSTYLCIANWEEVLTECLSDDSKIGEFNDSNTCYEDTDLSSYLEEQPENITYEFSCDYNDDGFIGDISNINTTLENVTKEQINNTIRFKENDETLLEFDFNLSEGKINFANLSIEKQSNESTFAYMLIKGLDLTSQNQTKTVYLDKITEGTGLCIKDEELTLISEISDGCNEENETWIACPGNSGNYSCELVKLVNNETQYKISGLRHSGVKEQETYCGDGIVNGNEECEIGNIPRSCSDYGFNAGSLSCTVTCTIDFSGCYTQDTDGGGGPGGGGGSSSSVSTTTKKTNQTASTTSEENKTTEITQEPVSNETESNNTITQYQGGFAGITGAFIGGIVDKGKGIIAIIFIVVIVGGFVGMWLWKKKNKIQVIYAPEEKEIGAKKEVKEPYWKEMMRKLTDKKK